jgi:vesicle-associated membrane protein 7
MPEERKPPQVESDQMKQLAREIDETKDVMAANINQVLERGDHLERLQVGTRDLAATTGEFRKTGAAYSRHMWWKNIWLIMAIVIVVALILAIICKFDDTFPLYRIV